jgi:hypothetical protein
MSPAPGGVRMGVSIMLVPHGGHIAGVCLEEQLRHGVQPFGRLLANGTSSIGRRLIERQLEFDDRAAVTALKIVSGH